ncbi:jg11912 [Pararge aegeria aegeria]|uniref:Jg11912 protein n=1 Tax=Pararge aegeria aegeria TaxID=348720 RepID=A0A8S4QMS2_9NEOP|nr:jg11912 [Pararge aegeria aegeria]
MRVWWGARAAVRMRVCCVTTVLAALALRSAAEPAPRRFEWRSGRDLQLRSPPLHEIFEPDSAPADQDQPYVQQPTLHKERRRTRNNKRAPHLPAELASQMMLRASRSGRPYDVPQIVQREGLPITTMGRRNGNITEDTARSTLYFLSRTTPAGREGLPTVF